MKVTLASLFVLSLSALIFAPMFPKEYPSEVEIEKSRVISHQERQLDNLLRKVEYQMKQDSIAIQSLKQVN